MATFAIVFAVIVAAATASFDEEINRINSVQNQWTAGHNAITEKGREYMDRLLGAKFDDDSNVPVRDDIEIVENIPSTFDARKQWSKCSTIREIKNQGNCGSCWAVALASVASDRLCIKSHGKKKLDISAENLLACCSACVDEGTGGCDGGYPIRGWSYFQQTGLVTGGDYGSNKGCQPYEIAPANNENMYTPPCQKRCTNKQYRVGFTRDKHFGQTSAQLPEDVQKIQSEILTNGPVEAGFLVYDDFFHYTGGVYEHTSPILRGGHAVRVLGWGTEGGKDYWLVANSWGEDWGDNGTFKIRRGTNECRFEQYMTAGLIKK